VIAPIQQPVATDLARMRLDLLCERHQAIRYWQSLPIAERRRWRCCLACGGSTGRALLCDGCRTRLAYCSTCETLYRRRTSLPSHRSTQDCAACMVRLARARRGNGSRNAYHARRLLRPRSLLPDLIERYRRGLTLDDIAVGMGLTATQIDVLIRDARRRGDWPEELRRIRRKDHDRAR
jgi:hypothetical protein